MDWRGLAGRDERTRGEEGTFSSSGSLAHALEGVRSPFAVVEVGGHTIVWGNEAFLHLASDGTRAVGQPIQQAFVGRDVTALLEVLDEVVKTGVVARDRVITSLDDAAPEWRCTVWPHGGAEGNPGHLVLELHPATAEELSREMQRDVSERMLLSALREQEVAERAEASRRDSTFLAAEGRRLAGSLNEEVTLKAIARLSLPRLAAWCIVDLLDDDGTMRRLAIIHPDPARQALLESLEGQWLPALDDGFGIPIALRTATSTYVADDLETALDASAHDPNIRSTLRAIGEGPLLTVRLVIRDRLVGAVTFVAPKHDGAFTEKDVALAEELAARAALALEGARMHGEAIALKTKAESASRAKSEFLATMSHELRTPLTAMGGYLDIIDMGLRGAVTEEQHADISRIRRSQRHVLTLINEVLNFVRIGERRMDYDNADVSAAEVVAEAIEIVEPLLTEKQLICGDVVCAKAVMLHADREKVIQILVNLLSNAIKFTPSGGTLAIGCEERGQTVFIHVTDTGIGIPHHKLETIFEPFVQVVTGPEARGRGVGLGLTISRELARAMKGDLTVESTLGVGTRFTLALPKSS